MRRRIKLTDEEYNTIMKLTANTHLDQEFDIFDCGDKDLFKDYDKYRMVSLKTGLTWLHDGLAYSLYHDGLNDHEVSLMVDLFLEFGVIKPGYDVKRLVEDL